MGPQYQISRHCTTIYCSSVAVQKYSYCNVTDTPQKVEILCECVQALAREPLEYEVSGGGVGHVRLTVIFPQKTVLFTIITRSGKYPSLIGNKLLRSQTGTLLHPFLRYRIRGGE